MPFAFFEERQDEELGAAPLQLARKRIGSHMWAHIIWARRGAIKLQFGARDSGLGQKSDADQTGDKEFRSLVLKILLTF
jgi:hypothetical protein